MGFPNEGADIFEKNIVKFRETGKNKNGLVGINIGKNKDTESFSDDYTQLIKRFAPQADYLTVNISSPNTEGLRDIQDPKHLAPFLDDLLKARQESAAPQCPIFVKLAPDLDESTLITMTDILCDKGIDGVILTNTTNSRPDTLPEEFRARQGGLSGPLLKSKSIAAISTVYKHSQGKLLIIGAGGISSAQDAFDMISAGASLVQLYTALIYQGPSIAEKTSQDLAILLHNYQIDHISQLIGRDHTDKRTSP
jgi:dihydroorotate dehydrogenase